MCAMDCISKKTGKPRSAFRSEKEAWKSAEYEKRTRGVELYPYKCERCGKYHLAPVADRINLVKKACGCVSSSGESKILYSTFRDVLKAKNKIQTEKNISLSIYACPEKRGFHLTHKQGDRGMSYMSTESCISSKPVKPAKKSKSAKRKSIFGFFRKLFSK